MARKYIIAPTIPAILEGIANAIADYYGAGNYTIHYTDATNVIFSVPAIFDKVMRIQLTDLNSWIYAYYGNAWTSGTTITNQVLFSNGNLNAIINSNSYLILGDTFFQLFTGSNPFGTILYGKLTNNTFACFSARTHQDYCDGMTPYTTVDNTRIYVYSMASKKANILSASGKILKCPLFVLNATLRMLEDPITFIPVSFIGINTTTYSTMVADADNIFIIPISTFDNAYFGWRYLNDHLAGQIVGSFVFEIDNHTL
ncbi:MAG: hypothetical protein CVT92_02435 [Bacteroidetes bacterium HGW-Bacteroidetes-1]|jgi:hypothetical protein|nr:MAG: hypothetical protein CVT92_02435 [Bacteroidetes bacterium HGW-Bacteroidetes-1]